MKEIYYRFRDYRTAPPLDEFENPIGRSQVHLQCMEFEVQHRTKFGVWILTNDEENSLKFVNDHTNKRYACPTKEEALVSFIARKQKQIKILKGQTRDAEEALALALRSLAT